MTFARGFKAEANRVALRVRAQLGLKAIDPIDPATVCSHYDIKLIKLSELDPRSSFLGNDKSPFSAMTVPCGLTTAIVHNDSHHPHRQRSNICHELAHCFLGHQCVPPLTPDGERVRNGGIEAEANFLAGTLLLTNEAALYILRTGLIAEVHELYGISRPMLNYRLKISGAQRIHERMQRAG